MLFFVKLSFSQIQCCFSILIQSWVHVNDVKKFCIRDSVFFLLFIKLTYHLFWKNSVFDYCILSSWRRFISNERISINGIWAPIFFLLSTISNNEFIRMTNFLNNPLVLIEHFIDWTTNVNNWFDEDLAYRLH